MLFIMQVRLVVAVIWGLSLYINITTTIITSLKRMYVIVISVAAIVVAVQCYIYHCTVKLGVSES
jgi:hypothetical protein